MTTILESEAHLRQRARDIGVQDATIENIVNYGIKKLSTLAFSRGQPGQVNTQFDAFQKSVNGGTAVNTADSAGLKQLLFESHVLVTQQLKSRIEEPPSESAVPKPIPLAERSARMTK